MDKYFALTAGWPNFDEGLSKIKLNDGHDGRFPHDHHRVYQANGS